MEAQCFQGLQSLVQKLGLIACRAQGTDAAVRYLRSVARSFLGLSICCDCISEHHANDACCAVLLYKFAF